MNAKDQGSSVTHASISAGTVEITDGTAQQALTGKTADETIAGLNRNTTQHDKLENLFTDEKKEQIKNGFEIVKTFGQQASTFLQYKASDVENAKKNAESLGKTLLTGPDGQPVINQLTGQVVYVSDMSQPDYAAFLAANPGVQTLYSQYVGNTP